MITEFFYIIVSASLITMVYMLVLMALLPDD